MSKHTKTPLPSWHDNKRRLFRSRLARMLIGDSLICEFTQWRVDCLPDNVSDLLYSITIPGEEPVKRKRLESAADYLINAKAPETLEFVRDGAQHLLEQDLTGVDEYLGYYPSVDMPVEPHPFTARLSFVHLLFQQMQSLLYRIMPGQHEVVRFVIQEGQIDWFGTSLKTTHAQV